MSDGASLILLFNGDKVRVERILVSLSISYLGWNSCHELFKFLSGKRFACFKMEVEKSRH
jgi:hypothetical protein